MTIENNKQLYLNVRSETVTRDDQEFRVVWCLVQGWDPEKLTDEVVQQVNDFCKETNASWWRWIDLNGKKVLMFEGTIDAECQPEVLQSNLFFAGNEIRRVHERIVKHERELALQVISPLLPGLMLQAI